MIKIIVENKEITVISTSDFDFISLTDMANAKENESKRPKLAKKISHGITLSPWAGKVDKADWAMAAWRRR